MLYIYVHSLDTSVQGICMIYMQWKKIGVEYQENINQKSVSVCTDDEAAVLNLKVSLFLILLSPAATASVRSWKASVTSTSMTLCTGTSR